MDQTSPRFTTPLNRFVVIRTKKYEELKIFPLNALSYNLRENKSVTTERLLVSYKIFYILMAIHTSIWP